MADVAFTFHFQPSELDELEVEELLLWHEQVRRINDQLSRK